MNFYHIVITKNTEFLPDNKTIFVSGNSIMLFKLSNLDANSIFFFLILLHVISANYLSQTDQGGRKIFRRGNVILIISLYI